jgi:hypothetical protein
MTWQHPVVSQFELTQRPLSKSIKESLRGEAEATIKYALRSLCTLRDVF